MAVSSTFSFPKAIIGQHFRGNEILILKAICIYSTLIRKTNIAKLSTPIRKRLLLGVENKMKLSQRRNTPD